MKTSDDWYQNGYQQGEQDEQDRIVALLLTLTRNQNGDVVWASNPEDVINEILEGKR